MPNRRFDDWDAIGAHLLTALAVIGGLIAAGWVLVRLVMAVM